MFKKFIDRFKRKHKEKIEKFLHQKPTYIFNGERFIDETVMICKGVIIQNPKNTTIKIEEFAQIGP